MTALNRNSVKSKVQRCEDEGFGKPGRSDAATAVSGCSVGQPVRGRAARETRRRDDPRRGGDSASAEPPEQDRRHF